MVKMGAAVHTLAVIALGALSATATFATVQYFLFLAQVLRMVSARERWVGDPIDNALLKAVEGASTIERWGALGVALQTACVVMAGVAFSRQRAQLGAPAVVTSRSDPVALAWAALAGGVLAATAFLRSVAPVLRRHVELVHAAGAAREHDGNAAAKLMGEGILGLITHSLAIIGFGAMQLALLLLTLVLASNALLTLGGMRRARTLAGSDGGAAHAWHQVPAPPLFALFMSALLLGLLGLLPAFVGSSRYFYLLIVGFGQLPELAAADQVPSFSATIERAAGELALSLDVALAGTAVATVLAIALIVVLPQRQRRALSSAPAPTLLPALAPVPVAVVLFALLGSAALLHAAAPYRAENANPIRMMAVFEYAFPIGTPLPPLAGPDAIEMAPILSFTPGKVKLDGRPVDPPAVARDLATMRRNWGILRPDEPFPGRLSVMCGQGTPLAETIAFLHAAHGERYVQLQFALGSWQSEQRPVMGKMLRPRFSAAAAELVGAGEAGLHPGASDLLLSAGSDCDSLARQLVAIRSTGRHVRVRLP